MSNQKEPLSGFLLSHKAPNLISQIGSHELSYMFVFMISTNMEIEISAPKLMLKSCNAHTSVTEHSHNFVVSLLRELSSCVVFAD